MSSTEPSNEALPSGLDTRLLREAVGARLFKAGGAEVVLGRFSVLERLGHGGMGVVYAAYDPKLDRRVAVKVLHEFASEHDVSARRRLEREAVAMARLSHPNVVTVHEVGNHEGKVFLAMEYVPGGTLVDWCGAHPPGEADRFEAALRLMRQVGAGIAAAHEAGLIHRDLKPHNVLLQPAGENEEPRAVVGDFGLAMFDESATSSRGAPRGEVTSGADAGDSAARLTLTGATPGTPAYMAPEQFDGRADERSDQWALCATFFEVLYGVRPFATTSEGEPSQCVEAPLDPRERHGVPAWMHRLLLRGMERDPSQRFPSVAALLAEIDRNHGGRRRHWWAGAALLGVGGVLAAVLSSRAEEIAPIESCHDGAEKLEAALGDERRAEIRAAFEATGEPYWEGTWERLSVRLDTYAEEWKTAHVDACEATRVRRVQTEKEWQLRTRCLDELVEALQITSDAFASATAQTVADASAVSLALAPPSECADLERLGSAEQGVSLMDPRVGEVTSALRRAAMLGELGRDDEARAQLEAIEATVETLGVPAIRGDILMLQIHLALKSGDWAEAEKLGLEALRVAENSGNLEGMALAWNRLAKAAEGAELTDKALFRADRALAFGGRRWPGRRSPRFVFGDQGGGDTRSPATRGRDFPAPGGDLAPGIPRSRARVVAPDQNQPRRQPRGWRATRTRRATGA